MTQSLSSKQVSVSRRKMFATASTLGAVAAAASLLPSIRSTVVSAPEVKPAPTRGGGYVLSEHVKRYYKTTLV
jgi:hypothetical protein